MLLETKKLSKRFPPNLDALTEVSLHVEAGEVVALLGANGAGKSTLTKVLTGIETPTTGAIYFLGERRNISSPAVAQRLGIVAVHQELPLLPNLTAAENCFLGARAGHEKLLSWRPLRLYRERYQEAARAVPAAPPADAKVEDLSIGEQQKVALIRALALNPRLLILDEVTSSLSADERRAVYTTVRETARARRIGVLYITHFIDDALEASDRIIVLRDGRVYLTAASEQVSLATILAALGAFAGEEEPTTAAARSCPSVGQDVAGEGMGMLVVQALVSEHVGPISLEVRPGECVGLYGHPGCGASELLEAIAGLRSHGGRVLWQGEPLKGDVTRRIRRHVLFCSGDRGRNLVQSWSVQENVGLPGRGRYAPWRRPDYRAERRQAQEVIERFGVVGRPETLISQLSGGNQQKVAIGRMAIRENPLLMLGDDLTRGVDVVARAQIHELLRSRLRQGAAVLMHSTDPEELVALCTRVLILFEGRIVQQLQGEQITLDALEAGTRVRYSSNVQPGR